MNPQRPFARERSRRSDDRRSARAIADPKVYRSSGYGMIRWSSSSILDPFDDTSTSIRYSKLSFADVDHDATRAARTLEFAVLRLCIKQIEVYIRILRRLKTCIDLLLILDGSAAKSSDHRSESRAGNRIFGRASIAP